MTIDKIDFAKLKPYGGDSKKCFEHLCYQIALKEYGHLGSFTPIDGSGGDGGVEFYLDLHTGERWGWQCKFFGDNGRLGISSRDTSIEDSLGRACLNHQGLTKWFLCLKTDLTPDTITSKGKTHKGERSWFENKLPKSIPSGRNVVLEHWGESSFITFLGQQRHIGLRSFFFGQLEFDEAWFKTKFDENFERIKDKYDSSLHTIDKYTQSIIDFTLFDSGYKKHLDTLEQELSEISKNIKNSIQNISKTRVPPNKKAKKQNLLLVCNNFQEHIHLVFEQIHFIQDCFSTYNQNLFETFNLKTLLDDFKVCYGKFNQHDFMDVTDSSGITDEIFYLESLILNFGDAYERFFRNYFHRNKYELHFIADAAKGKTHLSCDIAYTRIHGIDPKPAIFITGDKFTNETNLSEAFIKILGIPLEYSFDVFLQALDVYGSITGSKVPIIIDGLNETTHNRVFSTIWKNHLASFIHKISQHKNLVVVTTCRSSYANRVWDRISGDEFHQIRGFDNYDILHEAVEKYFNKYKLEADLQTADFYEFSNPIFLRIFCEIKISGQHHSIEVNLHENSVYDVFMEYLSQINKKVTRNHPSLRHNELFVHTSISTLSNYLWENNLREIPVLEFYHLIDGNNPYEQDRSKADILINEGLVFSRDMKEKGEYIGFTYDLLAGYMIGLTLIKNKNVNYFTSRSFIKKIVGETEEHPLFEDVISALCMLLPKIKQIKFHELINKDARSRFIKSRLFKSLPKCAKKRLEQKVAFNEYCFDGSIDALFELPAQHIKEFDVQLVTYLFATFDANKKYLFGRFKRTLSNTKHPLNASFFSVLLANMEMNTRDLSWTEYIREEPQFFETLILEFETKCFNKDKPESETFIKKQHLLSSIAVWVLTSTNRELRDRATRALYYYGRKFPKEFAGLVYESLKFNDPYVWQRTLAALYGVVMAEHNSLKSNMFRQDILPAICKNIYNLIFKENAPHSTTHILSRDYARRIIEIGLIHHPELLNIQEIRNIRPPYTFGGIRSLEESNYGATNHNFHGPIQMDFGNYTIGHIVNNNLEKKKVRNQIYWRILNLGWNNELFKEAESAIIKSNYSFSRGDRPKIERYGKKYSWIAYFENAGLRSDLGLLGESDEDYEDGTDFRISDADIDPSFPKMPENKPFIMNDLLGNRSVLLEEWYQQEDTPPIEDYLQVSNILENAGEWVCLDGFVVQEEVSAKREIFTFIRGFIVKGDDYDKLMVLLKKQSLAEHRLPDKRINYYTYAGELYYCDEATQKNTTILRFNVGKEKQKVKEGKPGYNEAFHSFIRRFDFLGHISDEELELRKDSELSDEELENITSKIPEELEIELTLTEEYEILIPVMKYNWGSYHSSLDDTRPVTILAKEIANYLKLVNQPQTFDLYESNGDLASTNLSYHDNHNNNHQLTYIRKDLFDKYLSENKYKFVWAIWGERSVQFASDGEREEFFNKHSLEQFKVFQKIIEYV